MKEFVFDVDYVRNQFPCLCRSVNGNPAAFFDGPGGTQVPVNVVEKMTDYLINHNANQAGHFITSVESDALFKTGREVLADFLGADSDEIAFGASSTSNLVRLAFGFARSFKPGDEVIITDIDHEGNRSPWRTLSDFGVVVKSVKVNPETCMLDMEDYEDKLTDKTKLVAVNWAANACGTITDVAHIIKLAHDKGAITVVDAVHYAPHYPIDVKELDVDILVCSAYKFFGPHLGIVYMKRSIGEKFKAVRVYADDNATMPSKLETGTPAFENVLGAVAAVEFIADIGEKYLECFAEKLGNSTGRRRKILAGMMAIAAYEKPLADYIRAELGKIDGIKLYMSPPDQPKTSTVSFTYRDINSSDVAEYLASKGIFVWYGDFYALQIVNSVLKLGDRGGLVRVGLEPYNTRQECDRLIESVKEFANTAKL